MFRMRTAFALMSWLVASTGWADVVVFTDGTRMEVERYEVKGEIVLLTSPQGKLQSVPRSYVDLEATERANRAGARTPQQTPESSEPAPAPVTQTARPPRAVPQKPAETPRPAEPEIAATPTPPPAALPATPPVWSDEELKVSLVIPSTDWQLEPTSRSFDVAVRLTRPETGAKATLALVRQRMRNYKDFQKVVGDIESSMAAVPSYRSMGSGPVSLEPYTAYELRMTRELEGQATFNRIVVFYSRDLAYVLSLSCPNEAVEQSEVDFDALIRGFVIKKVREDITPKGAPTG